MAEAALLLYEPSAPCWDEETFVLAGEAPGTADRLTSLGLLEKTAGGCILTAKGLAEREAAGRENYIAAEPLPPFEAAEALWNNRLHLLMDKKFTGRFGVKDYSVGETLAVVPLLPREKLFSVSEGRVSFVWQQEPLIKSFVEAFPKWGVSARDETPPGDEALREWAAVNGARQGGVSFNLLLRSRYDFELYRTVPPYPADKYKMKDCDRFFFTHVSEGSLDEYLETLALLQIFWLAQKRVYIPGYVQLDSQDQEAWTMSVAVADDEAELARIALRLEKSGKGLLTSVCPLFVIGTSVERLRHSVHFDTVYDWFCDDTVHIARPDV